MFNNGMTIDQIAKEHELVPSTIESHLGKAVETARLDISALVNEGELIEIKEVIRHLPSGFISKELYDGLRGRYGYGKLRAVMSHLKSSNDGEKNLQDLPNET